MDNPDAVAILCRNIAELRERATEDHQTELHAMVQEWTMQGTVELDRLRNLARALGGDLALDIRGVDVIGLGDGEPARVEYVCPRPDPCSRRGRREPSGPPPVCALTGKRMPVRAR
jgi:hypothetical protein